MCFNIQMNQGIREGLEYNKGKEKKWEGGWPPSSPTYLTGDKERYFWRTSMRGRKICSSS